MVDPSENMYTSVVLGLIKPPSGYFGGGDKYSIFCAHATVHTSSLRNRRRSAISKMVCLVERSTQIQSL